MWGGQLLACEAPSGSKGASRRRIGGLSAGAECWRTCPAEPGTCCTGCPYRVERGPGCPGVFPVVRVPGCPGVFRVVRVPGCPGVFRVVRVPGCPGVFGVVRVPGCPGVFPVVRVPGCPGGEVLEHGRVGVQESGGPGAGGSELTTQRALAAALQALL